MDGGIQLEEQKLYKNLATILFAIHHAFLTDRQKFNVHAIGLHKTQNANKQMENRPTLQESIHYTHPI
jgi:hypothetical protein